jgi:hypothetical protein
MNIIIEKFEQLKCHFFSNGKHSKFLFALKQYGDYYCTNCGKYLYTYYDQKTAKQERDSLLKLWNRK